MRNKFISLIMFLISLILITIMILLGLTVYEEVKNNLMYETSAQTNEARLYEPDYSHLSDSEEKNIEAPKINIESEELSKISNSNKNNTQNQEVSYENISVNKYFYKQLESYSQTIYKAFESNKEAMKSGTHKIELGSAFSDILSKQDGQEQLQKYYQSAIEAYLYDNPDVFYLSPKKMYLNIETTKKGSNTTYNTYLDCGNSPNYLSDEFNSKTKVVEALTEIEKVKNSIIKNRTGNAYKDIKMVHDYLVDNLEYDSTFEKNNIYNIYGALVNKECVCEGYAKSFKYILNEMGIDTTMVIGKAYNSSGDSENHAWNYVKLNDNWYAIDVTWDDPIIIGNGTVGKEIKYKYFLKGSDSIKSDHFPSGQFTEGGKLFEYPNLSKKDY